MSLLLALLCIVGVAGMALVVLGHFLRRDHIGITGGIAQGLGLATIAAAVGVWFLPQMRASDGAALESELAAARSALVAARQQTVEARETAAAKLQLKEGLLAKSNERLQAALSAERSRLRALYEAAGEANPVRSATHSDTAQIETASTGSQATSAANQLQAERVEQRIAKLANILRAKRDVEVRDPADFGKVAKLRDRMNFGFETEHFEVEVYPDNEMVKGQQGKYYVIDIKNAETGTRFQFGGGKYTLARSSKAFRRGLRSFMREVVQTVEGNADYVLFVRGSADSIPYSGRHENGYDYREVRFMPSVEEGKYVNNFKTQEIGKRIRNRDLPFLRAEFLRQVVSEVYPLKPAIVLQGEVTRAANKEDRNAELILYVNW
ncbi:MAG: hypothetical protein AAFR55_05655 [Pseudomonadota bacterium]